MRQLFWTETAKNDLQQIYDYIAENSVFYADKFIDDLFERAEILKSFPEIGRVVPEIAGQDVREIFHYSYRVMYCVSDRHIHITQITHMAQDFKP